MKKCKIFLFCIIYILLLVSCGKKEEIIAADLAYQINERAAFSETLTELDTNGAEQYYFLNPNDYSEITAYVGTKSVCDGFVIIKTSDTSTIKEKLNTHLKRMRSSYSEYRPDQVYKLDNAFMGEHNGTVVLIVSSDKALSEQIFNEYLKK